MRIVTWAATVLALTIGAPPSRAEDDPGKMKPSELLKRCSESMDALAGYNMEVGIKTSTLGRTVSDFKVSGVHVKPDLYGFETENEVMVYVKGSKVLARLPGGAWSGPVDAGTAMAEQAGTEFLLAFPKMLLGCMLKKAGSAKAVEGEEVGGVPCRAVQIAAGADDVGRIAGKELLEGDSPIDKGKSTCTYTAWIGDDLLLHAISVRLDLPVKDEGMEVPFSITQTRTAVISDHGRPNFHPPDEVRKKLGVKDAPPAAAGSGASQPPGEDEEAAEDGGVEDDGGSAGSADEEKARAMLTVAEQFAKNKMPEKAAEKLRDLIAKFPNTQAAATAKTRLAEIEGAGEKK